MTHWHILTLKPGKGAFVKARLEAHGFELYWPMYEAWLLKRGTRRRETVLRPYIPGYMFSRTSKPPWAAERLSMGGAIPMMNGDGPVTIPDSALDPLRAKIAETPPDNAGKVVEFAQGEMLRILAGPFMGLPAKFDKAERNGEISANVNIFGRETPVSIHVAEVERIG